MARSKAEKVRAAPKTVTLEGVDENGEEVEISWEVRPLKGDEMLKLEDIPENQSGKRLKHLVYESLKDDDPNLEKENCLSVFDFKHLEKVLQTIAEVNDLEDFFDEDEIKEALKERSQA